MRRDIQFLRGVAVLVVVLFHAGIDSFKNGFLGVDIFFVISGFLITSIVLKDIDNNKFSFQQFYLRRAKRLLPAIYCTLIFTSALSYFFLTHDQWMDYVAQLIGAVTFTANIVLPHQVGYFDSAAEGKPLLHIWSLSLEEQYYLFLPLLLFLCGRRIRAPILALLMIGSMALCFWFVSRPTGIWRLPGNSAVWAFYLFPTRAWELLAGSIAAWSALRFRGIRVPIILKRAAFCVILAVVCFPLDEVHPRGDAVVVVLATAILILGQDNWLPELKAVRVTERLGDWSYSLYLVHWPLFAFAHNAYLGKTPDTIKVLLVPVAVVLAYLQYRYVEETFRHGWQRAASTTWFGLLAATISVFLVLVPGAISQPVVTDFSSIRRINYGLSWRCQGFPPGRNRPAKECSTEKDPVVAVWGDSYAMHLVPGLIKNKDLPGGLIQITKSACGPFIGLAIVQERHNREWGRECIEFNNRAMQIISETKSIKYVFISSRIPMLIGDGADRKILFDDKILAISRDLIVRHLVDSIKAIIRAGKRPILVSPLPNAGFNIGECLERDEQNIIVLGRNSCNFSREEFEFHSGKIFESLRMVEEETNVPVIWLHDIICDNHECFPKKDGIYTYRDEGHLTISGSEYIIGSMDLSKIF